MNEVGVDYDDQGVVYGFSRVNFQAYKDRRDSHAIPLFPTI